MVNFQACSPPNVTPRLSYKTRSRFGFHRVYCPCDDCITHPGNPAKLNTGVFTPFFFLSIEIFTNEERRRNMTLYVAATDATLDFGFGPNIFRVRQAYFTCTPFLPHKRHTFIDVGHRNSVWNAREGLKSHNITITFSSQRSERLGGTVVLGQS
jgi:hypothetical protein